MIKSKEDYLRYLEADRLAGYHKSFKPRLIGDDIWKFQRLLRKLEYLENCKKDYFSKLFKLFIKFCFNQLSIKLGFTIPPNTFGPGLSIAHRGTIVVHGKTRVGANCRIHVCVNIGAEAGDANLVPNIGNNVYIGPGAKIFGGVVIADNIAIGANAVVNKSFLEPGITIGGIPAKKISEKGSLGLLKAGMKLMSVAKGD